jgi:hypothetical protein
VKPLLNILALLIMAAPSISSADQTDFSTAAQALAQDSMIVGSDFDGVGDSLPEGMKDVSFYPYLIERLLKLEYSTQDIKAILGGNLMRVWREVENYTEKQVTAYSRPLQPELQQPGA